MLTAEAEEVPVKQADEALADTRYIPNECFIFIHQPHRFSDSQTDSPMRLGCVSSDIQGHHLYIYRSWRVPRFTVKLTYTGIYRSWRVPILCLVTHVARISSVIPYTCRCGTAFLFMKFMINFILKFNYSLCVVSVLKYRLKIFFIWTYVMV